MEELEAEYAVPTTWEMGPVQNHLRGRTDKICLFLFIAYLIFLAGTGIYGLMNSNPDDISKVYDSSGNSCGEDSAKDYPLLYL